MSLEGSDRIVEAYYADVRNKQLLTPDYERNLFAAYRTCSKCKRTYTEPSTTVRCPACNERRDLRAREKIVEGSLRFVVKVAKYYARNAKGRDYESTLLTDLISAGNHGLLIAVDAFDTSLGTRFLTYAVHWIKEKIRSELDNSGTVRVPAYRQKAIRAQLKYGSSNELPAPLVVIDSLEQIENKPNEEYVEHDLINALGGDLIHRSLSELGIRGRDKYILLAYFGVRDVPRNLCQISNQLDLSSERVRVIKKQTMERLREHLAAQRIGGSDDVFTLSGE